MKKILLSLIIIILVFIAYTVIANGISVGDFEVESFSQVKDLNSKIDSKLGEVKKLTAQDYPAEVDTLKSVIKSLSTIKQTYENKVDSNTDESSAGIVQIDNYKVEFLFTTIGNYAKDEGVKLTLNIESNKSTGTNDLDFTVIGEYKDVADFMDDIISDDIYNFYIENFSMLPNSLIETESVQGLADTTLSTSSTSQPFESKTINTIKDYIDSTVENSVTTYNPNSVKAEFTVSDVGIDFS